MNPSFPAPITSINTDESGHKIAVTLQDGSVSQLSSENLSPLHKFTLSGCSAISASFSSNKHGPLLAVGCSDGIVRIFNNSSEISRLGHAKGAVLSVAFHPTRCIVASASLDGTFSVHSRSESGEWSSTTVDACRMGLTAIVWGPDTGSELLTTLIAGGADGVIRVFQSVGSTWEQIAAAQVHNSWCRGIASPNVPMTGTYKVASCADDSVYILKITNNVIEKVIMRALDFPVNGVGFAMVDKTLVLSHTNGAASMWSENESGEWVRTGGHQ